MHYNVFFMKSLRNSAWAAIAWRYGTHALMVGVALWNERRAAPSLPDVVLSQVPRVEWLAQHNYHLWVIAWLPLAVWLLLRERPLFLRFMWVGGWLSLVRAACIPLTGLGPIEAPDRNAGADVATLWQAWLAIVNPVSALSTDAAHVGLTKDYFFSGHVATTFLLWLYVRRVPRLGVLALTGHLGTTAVVLLSHLHYSIDIVGAWAITYSVYVLAEGSGPAFPAPGAGERATSA